MRCTDESDAMYVKQVVMLLFALSTCSGLAELCGVVTICVPKSFCLLSVTETSLLCSVKFFPLDTWRISGVSSVTWVRFLAHLASIARHINLCWCVSVGLAVDSLYVNDYERACL